MRAKVTVLAVLISLFLITGLFFTTSSQDLRVAILDVGQGDAIFISTPGGHQILIDAGPDGTTRRLLGRAMPFYDRTIDLAIITHPHLDHYGGFDEVLGRYRIRRLLVSGTVGEAPEHEAALQKMQRHGVPVTVVDHGYEVDFGDGVRLRTIYPNTAIDPRPADVNEVSVVVRIEYGVNSVLLMGDSPESIQRELVIRERLGSTVLKVAHHGSRDGSLPEFLTEVDARWAVISVGKKNTYGHPARETIEKLDRARIQTFRTDRDGTVEFRSHGGELFQLQLRAL